MAEPKSPQDDEHIEELLSQLQGIFGRLSHTEDEDARDKIDLPPSPPPKEVPEEPKAPETPAPAPSTEPFVVAESPAAGTSEKASDAPPSISAWEVIPLDPISKPEPPAPEPVHEEPPPSIVEPAPASNPVTTVPPAPVMEEPIVTAPPAMPTIEPTAAPIGKPVFEMSAEELAALEPNVTQTLVLYPIGRENEARLLANKLETMTPKFTKIAFQLKVVMSDIYDQRADLKEQIQSHLNSRPVRTVFVIVDRPLEEPRKRAITMDFEPKGIYFQDVPLLSVEKKAFFTDLLLGIVFFLDSAKPTDRPRP